MQNNMQEDPMSYIDDYIRELKISQEIDDYVNKNIYPESLKSKTRPIYKYFEYDEKTSIDTTCVEKTFKENKENLNTWAQNCLNKCNHIENMLKNYSDEINNATCPICIEPLGDNDYFVPLCGHKVCRKCALTNLCNNKNTGNACSLCRKIIF